jgi:hypothetical protein
MNFLFSYTCKLIRKDRNKVDILFFRIQVLIQYYFLSVTSIKICPRARWSTTAKTVAGTGIEGSSANQLSWPVGIFIHKEKNTLYVADSENNRVQMFKLNESSITGNTVASSVQTPVSVYVDDDGGELVIYIALQGSNRLEKWVQGASSGIQVGDECRSCAGVWLDKEKNVYMAEASRSRVVKWSPSTQEISLGPRTIFSILSKVFMFIRPTVQSMWPINLITEFRNGPEMQKRALPWLDGAIVLQARMLHR